MRASAVAAGVLVVVALLVAGCTSSPQPAPTSGGDTSGTPAGNATQPVGNATTNATAHVTLTVGTSGQYPVNPGFDPATLSAPAGQMVHLTFTNAEVLPVFAHNWVLEGVSDAKTDTIDPGASDEAQFRAPAEAGDYPYYCDIGDHRDRGMEGTFTVTAA